MGGSAGNSNAQLFQLMSQYGGGGGGKGPSRKDVFQQQFADYIKNHTNGASGIFAGFGDSFGGRRTGGGGGGNKPPASTQPPATEAEKFQWQFPQYTQTWAFTPPEPTPYMYPQPFDTKKFGNPLPKEKKKK